ncbi:MAG: endonuclease MutS2 [Candidatus Obscuribacterales bacterium]
MTPIIESDDLDLRSFRSLEWDRLLSFLAEEALSVYGREICASHPLSLDRKEIETLLSQTTEAEAVLSSQSPLLVDPVPDLREILARLSRGALLSNLDLLRVRDVLGLASRVKSSLSLMSPDTFGALTAFSPRLYPLSEVRKELFDCLDDRGDVKDDASPELKRLRSGIRKLHEEIKKDLNRLIHSASMSQVLQEPIITQRNGRYVLPVDANKRGSLTGIVHDSSQSGLTVYIEPMSVVEPTNKIRLFEAEAEREVERILTGLSRLCFENLDRIEADFLCLTDLDVIMARARLSLRYRGFAPELSSDDRIELLEGRHPLLVLKGEKRVVGNDFSLGGRDRTLVITGPNTGGKTVLLKQVGLMALMVRAGMHLPVKPGSRIPVFRKVWADIGDEQSLEQSLSTFSSHMQNIVAVVENASPGILILLDEIGVGTDPREGAAIAEAVLEHLTDSGALTVTTTHYSELKLLAYEKQGFLNGSLEFDEATLAPTYKLRPNLPGSSKGVVIAERLGLSAAVVERVRELLDQGSGDLDKTMAELESRLLRLAEAEDEAAERSRLLTESEERLKAEADSLARRRLSLEKQAAGVFEEQYREAADRIKNLTRELQAGPSLKAAQKARDELVSIKESLDAAGGRTEPVSKEPARVEPGQHVLIASLNQRGVVDSVKAEDSKAVVICGSMKVNVSLEDLVPVQAPARTRVKPGAARKKQRNIKSGAETAQRDRLDSFVSTSLNTVDLRGKRVDEALDRLEEFLDSCMVSQISPVMVIHGHGTGAVKAATRSYLSDSRYCRRFRPGELFEGGDGVTVVDLN